MPTHPLKWRSAALTDGASRAPARAMLRATGLTDEDLRRPLIGVANTWIEIGPCNYHLRELAVHVKDGIREAGGTPLEFNTVSISDGITMGSEGMRTSLVSREVIADSIELVARGNLFDALVVLVGCDKTIPAAVMALARLDIPGLVLYGGSIAPGRWHDRDVTIQDVFEAVGAHAAGTLQHAGPRRARAAGLSRRRRLRRAVHRQHDGDRVRVPRHLAVRQRQRAGRRRTTRSAVARAAGALVMDVLRRGLRPRQIITRDALENAIAAVAATGGSTNAVLHLLAIAREAGVPLDIDDFNRVSARVPLLADLKPGGRFVATDLHRAGGIPLVAKRLLDGGHLHADAITITGRTIGEQAREATETAGPEVVRPLSNPIKPTGGLVILKGNLAPEGAVVKVAGYDIKTHVRPGARLRQRRGGVRGGPDRRDQARRRRRHPLRGSERRPGHARDARRHRRDRGRRPRRLGGARHRRPVLRRDARPDGRPRGARSGARRSDRRGARRRHHHLRSHRRAR